MSKKVNVCLDSGHGGKQPGAVSSTFGYKEKDIALDITLMVSAYLLYATPYKLSGGWILNDVCPADVKPHVNVILTRSSDVDVTLSRRCVIANENRATCFVSIHCNSCNSETANGIETWYYKTGSRQSKMFAQEVQSCLIAETNGFLVKEKDGTSHAPKDRGVRSNTFYYTLRHTTMPSLVVECGFMSHDGEVQLMMKQEYQNAIARGIARGILNTFAL